MGFILQKRAFIDKLVSSHLESFEFTALEVCKNYSVLAKYYIGLNGDKPIYTGGESNFLSQVRTLPDLKIPFELKNVQASMQKDTLIFIWDQSDLHDCISINDLKISICRRFLERGSCFQVSISYMILCSY